MKKVGVILSAVVITVMMLSSCGEEASKEKSVSKEKSASKEVTIGKQVWMTQNLSVDKFRNGEPIPEAKTDEQWKKAGENKQPVWCYYDNDSANGVKYGKLYNWYAVNDSRGLAPVGYHIPSETEWTKLIVYLGGGSLAETKMKSKSGWNSYTTGGEEEMPEVTNSGNGTNTSSFSGLPGGERYHFGNFLVVGYSGSWWSRTEDDIDHAYFFNLSSSHPSLLGFLSSEKAKGFSVRCLRD